MAPNKTRARSTVSTEHGPGDVSSPALQPVAELTRWAAEESMLFSDEGSPFRAVVAAGAPRLVIVTGENASGKSLLFRVVAARARQCDTTMFTLSIRERAGAGTHEMARMRQAMMFGDEAEQSTGATSVRSIQSGFTNLDRPGATALGLDEPELGLSDGYARALGAFIGTSASQIPESCSGVVVVTHNRALVAGLLESYGTRATFVSVHPHGADPTAASVEEWLAMEEKRTVDDLLALPQVGLERWRAANTLLRAP